MYNKKVWNTGDRITADKLNNIEEGVYSNALVNKTQQVYINGLFNENKDGRLSVEGEGNSLKLEGSKQGLVEVDKVVGNTFVNLATLESELHGENVTFYYKDATLCETSMLKLGADYTIIIFKEYLDNHNENYNYFEFGVSNVIGGFQTNINTPPISYNKDKFEVIVKKVNFDDFKGYKYLSCRPCRRSSTPVDGEVANYLIKVIMLEGDYTNKPIPQEYFEGLQSSFESNLVTQEMVEQGLESEENLGKYKVPIKLIGKNLIKPNFTQRTGMGSAGNGLTYPNMLTYSTSRCATDTPINVKPNTTYVFNQTNLYDYAVIELDNNMTQILDSGWSVTSIKPTHTTSNRCKYIVIIIKWANQSSPSITIDDIVNVQLEENTIVTDYEDYFERTTNAYLNSPLLEGDEIVMKDGELCHYHKYYKDVFDGSSDETWVRSIGSDSKTITSYFALWRTTKEMLNKGTAICDTLSTISPNFVLSEYESEGIRQSSGSLYVNINKSRLTSDTNEGYREWLQSNPMTVLYELANPYYEPIKADKLLLECANDSTLHINTVVPVESVKASYTGNIPSVYALEETNQTQDDLIDISLCATDEMYAMIEPLLEVVPQTLNNERMMSKMVDMYVAMVIRGLKTIDEVPVRYREQVKEILNSLEK